MENSTNTFNYSSVLGNKHLNTFAFETGLHHLKPLSSICDNTVEGNIIDTPEGFIKYFSLDQRLEKWGENYKENNPITTQRLNGEEDEIILPSVMGGGMGIDVSSMSLVEESSVKDNGGDNYAVSTHLSSIGISYFKQPDIFEDNGKGFDRYGDFVEKEFYDLFEKKLSLTKKQINEHFLKSDDFFNLDKENFHNTTFGHNSRYLDSSFQPTNKKGEIFLMKDLLELYKEINTGKNKSLFIAVNHMYKSVSYVSSIKVAALAGVDAITTGAGIPRTGYKEKNNDFVNPRDIVKNFFDDIGKLDLKMPAFGLIVSMTMAYSPGYDYYIDEDPRSAGGHQGALESMLTKEKKVGKKHVVNSLREREGINNSTPIYAGGGINSASDIKELFDMGFDGVQLGTSFAVTKEARGGEGVDFKQSLISGNHFGSESEIDTISKDAVEKLKENIIREVENARNKVFNILTNKPNLKLENEYSPKEIENVVLVIMDEIFNKTPKNTTILNKKEEEIYDKISDELFNTYDGDIDKLRKDMKGYGNLQKAMDEFIKFENIGILPTHLLFDSVVGFIGRMRINGGEHRLLNDTVMRSITCIQCVNHCILRNVGGVQSNRGSKFCIADSLRLGSVEEEKSLVLNFSGLTTSFYDEIRPIKDILVTFAGTEVKR